MYTFVYKIQHNIKWYFIFRVLHSIMSKEPMSVTETEKWRYPWFKSGLYQENINHDFISNIEAEISNI